MSKLKDLLNSPRLKAELIMLSSQENITLQSSSLRELITQISNSYGGDNPTWLAQATAEIINDWNDRLEEAINLLNNTYQPLPPKEIKL